MLLMAIPDNAKKARMFFLFLLLVCFFPPLWLVSGVVTPSSCIQKYNMTHTLRKNVPWIDFYYRPLKLPDLNF